MTSTLVTLPGYHLTEQLHQSDRTVVYRGRDLAHERPVVIKLMRQDYPSFRELVQFRNQYAIAKNLEIEGVVKSIALERYENRYALVMEDTGGISLAEYKQQSSLSLLQFLEIALQLARILHRLHQNRVIHKDIKPANILIHPQTKQINLIDFSISSLLPKETLQIQNPNILEGTLAYISPEQTGRMNRGIDYRSDFYSLGVTLYELLTGFLPFEGNDPMELIHRHMAQAPLSVQIFLDGQGNAHPEAIGAIILKLMAKNAEDRYQSALGLKYDLEKCLSQWQETGRIEPFILGERDRCDRFLIPEKLYGREVEVETLLNAFNRVATGNSKLMLVAGFSGIGKTAVVNEVHKPIVKQRGYFIKGKFDQFNRNIPFSAFVQAFRSLMGQILSESDAQLQKWKTKILEAVGTNGQVLIDAIPSLESVIGKQSPVPELSGSAAQNRFNLLFEKFIAVFTTKNHPLTIFLDDLQWADSASLNLMKVLMGDSDRGYLLLLGAYRDNEVFPAHPLMLVLAELAKQEAIISTITLSPLSQYHINQLVAETLSCKVKQSQPLTELVYQKTQGNPFFTTQFLKGLYEDKLIVFNPNLGYWECDLVKVRDAALTSDVVEFMAGRLQKLPAATQEVLKLAACVGNQFDLETLAVVCETPSEEVASQLWSALQERIILPISEAYKFFQGEIDSSRAETITVNYRFLHDRVQQAAYSLIPDGQKEIAHYRIGKLLLSKIPSEMREERIFEVVNQLNYGTNLITEPSERVCLAELNLIAARKARATIAYQVGRDYTNISLSLIGENAWQQQYQLCVAFHELAAELSLLCSDFETLERFANAAIANIPSFVEQSNIYRIKIQSYVTQNQPSDAITTGREFLARLNVVFPETPTQEDIGLALQEVGQLICRQNLDELSDLPLMTDREKVAIVQTITSIQAPSFICNPPLFPLLVLAAVRLSIQFGNTANSANAYICYAMICLNLLHDIETGVKFGEIALNVISKLNAVINKPEILCGIGGFVHHRKSHIRETLSVLQEGYTSALEVGNLEYAGHDIHLFCLNLTTCTRSLQDLEQKSRTYSQQLTQQKHIASAHYCCIFWQFSLNLLNESERQTILTGTALEETKIIAHFENISDFVGLNFLYCCKLILCYWFGELEIAQHCTNKIRHYFASGAGMVVEPIFYFYDSLLVLSDERNTQEETLEKNLERIEENQSKLQQFWAKYAPMNHQHKVNLVEAEKCRVLGQKLEAIDLYDRAIAGAKENEYIQEEALANELAAKFYLDWGKEKIARTYLTDAYYCYAQWGAKAKIDQLEQRYPELLKPILQRDRTSSTSSTSLSTVTSHSQTASIADISSILDFSSLLKASQTLSGEIELDRLLSTLIKIILENAGATKGALLLTSEQGLTIEAIATRDDDDLQLDSLHQSIPLEDYSDLPSGSINYVKRTAETLLLDAKTAQTQFAADNYLRCFSPQSLLCLPLLERGHLIGILYLENTLTADAFTRDRVELLDALCAQAAISLTNARLYQQAQQALKDLQTAQLQLVQNEKMATLGNLVAGVAHEINNPVGFIGGNITVIQEYLNDLYTIIEGYREELPNPSPQLAENIEELDFNFLLEDFPKTIASMQKGCDRIRNISTSLRTFSRTDTNVKTGFNLHEGIDSTLLILKYRLKANENRPAIEIVKQYGELPEVKCFPGQLNQVFMNLIANAIDALDESNEGKTFAEIEKAPNRITIATELVPLENNVMVSITDNGTGMAEEVRTKIFEQGFTTKGVGKGTGLGMAIAHQIVTEKHGGTIACQSQLGKGTRFVIKIPLPA